MVDLEVFDFDHLFAEKYTGELEFFIEERSDDHIVSRIASKRGDVESIWYRSCRCYVLVFRCHSYFIGYPKNEAKSTRQRFSSCC